MATARLRTSRKTTTKKVVTTTHNRVKVKSGKGASTSSGKKRGNPNHCPVCGKFM